MTRREGRVQPYLKKIIIFTVILFLLSAAGRIVWLCRYYFPGTSSTPVQAKENEDFGIVDFHSDEDKDGDGIVSDKRNDDGVAYILHHNDPFQKSYEEDILESRDDVTGYYRVNE